MKKFIITEEEKSRILDMHKSRTSQQYMNESTQFVEETLLNKDTAKVNVYAQTNWIDGKPLSGAKVDWYTSERDIKTMGGPGIKVTLPNGEMESNESIKVYVISKANNKTLAHFVLTASEIKTNNAKGRAFKTQKANVQGKKVGCMFKWNPNGITVKADFAKKTTGGGSKTAGRSATGGAISRIAHTVASKYGG